MHNRHPIVSPRIRLTGAKFPIKFLIAEITSTARTSGVMARNRIILIIRTCMLLFDILCTLPLQLSLILAVFGSVGGAVLAADFSDAENGFPALETGIALRGWVAETGGGEGAFCPAVVDAGEMPVYSVGGGVAVELVADVDEVLDGCDVDVIDG